MVLIAANEPNGTEGFSWEKAGDAGAIEIPPHVAITLLKIPGDLFYVVNKEVKKVEKTIEDKAEEITSKKAPAKLAKEEVAPAADISEALDVASPTKRKSKE